MCIMNAVVLLEWKFSPSDFFEQVSEICCQDQTITISDGHAQAKLDAAIYDADPDIRQRLHDALNDRFLGEQLFTHRAYELSRSTVSRLHPDGQRHVFLEPEPLQIGVSCGTIDIRVTDKDGNVIADSKRDRIEKKQCFADLVAACRSRDETAASLLRSYDAAVRDPNNELVHLYEIREAIAVKLGGERKACKTLGTTESQWSRLGQLCNHEPLRQGRHRGKTGTALRDATEAELAEARGIACAMIKAYLHYVKRSASPA